MRAKNIIQIDVSTLLEILPSASSRNASKCSLLVFQPFLRFYEVAVHPRLVVRPDPLHLFQPFLRFYNTTNAGRTPHIFRVRWFQPFLRFYQNSPGAGAQGAVAQQFQPFLRFYKN